VSEVLLRAEQSVNAQTFDAYRASNHAKVNALIAAPAISEENRLGVVNHRTVLSKHPGPGASNGQYRHLIANELELNLPPRISADNRDKWLEAGWRSEVVASLRAAQLPVASAVEGLKEMLEDTTWGCELTDSSGKKVAADDIRLKDTLFAFELSRNEILQQIAYPPQLPQVAGSANAGAPLSKSSDAADKASAAEAQAKGLIGLSGGYSSLKLKMSSQDAAHRLTLRVERREIDGTTALNELNSMSAKLDEELEVFHEKVLDKDGSDLLKHWLTVQFEARREELAEIRKKIQASARAMASTFRLEQAADPGQNASA
jgi:hypothetical protein